MTRLAGPDALRGIACVAVVIHHIAHFTPEVTGAVHQFAKMFFGLGVPLFFMISAFALKTSYDKKLSSANAILAYSIRRVMRIFPLYLLLLLFYAYFYSPINSEWSLDKKIAHYAMYATLMFGLLPSIAHGLVWASWSISVEALFYAVFPLFASRTIKLGALISTVVIGHLVSYLLASSIAPSAIDAPWYWAVAWHQYIPFFALGLIVHFLYNLTSLNGENFSKRLMSFSFIASVLLTAVVCFFLEWPFDIEGKVMPAKFVNLLIASTPLLFFILLLATVSSPKILVNSISIFLGKISYSIYLIHPLLIFFLMPKVQVIQNALKFPSLSFFFITCLTFVMLIPISYLSFKCIENPFIRLGKFCTAKLSQ